MTLTKMCTKCGECKPLDGFYKDKGCLHGVTSQCKQCLKARVKAYSQTEQGRAVHQAADRKYRSTERGVETRRARAAKPEARAQRAAYASTERGKEALRRGRAKWRQSDGGAQSIAQWRSLPDVQERMRDHRRKYAKSERGAETRSLYQKRQIAALSDDYIRRFLFKTLGIKGGDITPELIVMKREQLALRRMARQLKEAANESITKHP